MSACSTRRHLVVLFVSVSIVNNGGRTDGADAAAANETKTLTQHGGTIFRKALWTSRASIKTRVILHS
jgi:hypothetical protein